MIGDKLASGAASATFTGPRLKIDETEMQQDLARLPVAAFREKYWVTQNEYDLLLQSDGEKTSTLIRAMHEELEVIERLAAQDKAEDEGLHRQCFIDPFVAMNVTGRVIVSRDQPAAKAQSKLALPRHMRKERERLPTTGHIIRAKLYDSSGKDVGKAYIGLRILFGPMSGQAICFKNFPTWIALDINEVIGIVRKEDAEVLEEELEPLT